MPRRSGNGSRRHTKRKKLTIREDLETKVNEIFERMYHGHRRVAIDAKYHVELLTTISDRDCRWRV